MYRACTSPRFSHERVNSSTIDSHFKALPFVVLPNTKSQPDMVRMLGPLPMAAVGTRSQTTLFPLLLGHFQPFSAPQAMHSRVARLPAFATKQSTNPTIAESRPTLRQLPHPLQQTSLVTARLRLVTLGAARLASHTTRPAFRCHKLLLKLLRGDSLSRRAY